MARAANPVAPTLSNTVPDRITERVGAIETDLAAVEALAEVLTDVGADGTVLTSTGTVAGWEAIPE